MHKLLIFLIIGVILSSCNSFKKSEDGDNILKKKRINPNVDERAREAADKGAGLFGKNSGGSTTYDFATSNVLWRATLETFEDIPLNVVDYSGGIVSTEWYSGKIESNESIKLTIRFLSNEASISSIKVISHKKKCKDSNCQISRLDADFESKIKNKIFNKVRELKTKDEKNKK